jgi:hypothetical protein
LTDTRPIKIRLIDRNDNVLDTIMFPPRMEGQPPRVFGWCGRKFLEDDTGWYDEPSAVEISMPQQLQEKMQRILGNQPHDTGKLVRVGEEVKEVK